MANIAVFLCLAAFASTVYGYNLPYTINCTDQASCQKDLLQWCLVGEKVPVQGHCELQKRVCNGSEVDFSNRCLFPYAIDCGETRTCLPNLQPFCLEGVAEPVLGHCAVQKEICDNGAAYDVTESCLN